ncbi:PaaI family thioesterase [Enterovirga sp. GCM10030262]|uniref:PaaI family thioesterase n=1 Tax=Enterovirga sp. GCM10030262 TaxID=3273391 RepID=UPI00361D0D03
MTRPDDQEAAGAAAHFRALESLYRRAPVNALFDSDVEIEEGFARIRFTVDERIHHAAGAAHGTLYFKMMDDAAFYACNSLVTDRFLLTTAFNLHFTRPLRSGPAVAEGRWASGKRRVFVADARLIDAEGEEAARGTGTFMRSRIPLTSLDGYSA